MEEMELYLVACNDAVILELTSLGTGQASAERYLLPLHKAKSDHSGNYVK